MNILGEMAETTRDFDFFVTVADVEASKQFDFTKTLKNGSIITGKVTTGTDGKVPFALKDGEEIIITLPTGKVTALSETSVTGYTTKIALNSMPGALTPEIADNNGVKTLTFSEPLKNNGTVYILNYLGTIAPTGVTLRFLPWILMALAGGAILLIFRRRRSDDE